MKGKLAPSAWIAEVTVRQSSPRAPFHDAQVVGPFQVLNSLRLTVKATNSEDYTTALQHLNKGGDVLAQIFSKEMTTQRTNLLLFISS